RDLEANELVSIASRSEELGHAYGIDGDVGLPDSGINRWDLGNDPIAFAKTRTELAFSLRDKLLARAVKVGEGWDRLPRAFLMALMAQACSGFVASRLPGGQEIHRAHKGDPHEHAPLVVAPSARQREALQFACKTVFEDASYKLSPELITHLESSHWDHWGDT